MRIRMNRKCIVACIMVGTITVAGAGSAFAANVSTSTKETKPHCSQRVDFKTTYEAALKNLVSKGTLTQDQADKILNSFPIMKGAEKTTLPGKSFPGKGGGFLNQLVKNSTITQEQANSIESAMKTAREFGKSLSNVLSELVSSGVITQDQANSISAAFPDKNGPKAGGFLNQLVKNSTITQEQANSIESAMKTARESGKSLSNVLSELVSSGAITQDQANSISAAFPDKNDKKSNHFLDLLVKNGTITQEQENAINTEIGCK